MYLMRSVLSHSNTNAKKWETELQTLRENNARLVDALQESSANVESWKKQLNACKEESDALRQKVRHSNNVCNRSVFPLTGEKKKTQGMIVRLIRYC